MKKFLVWLMLLCLLLPAAGAEEAAAQTEEAAVWHLPVDFSAGPKANPENYTKDTYEDESLSVRMETRNIDRVRYSIAWIKVKGPTQLRTYTAGKPNEVRLARPSRMARNQNAVVAINGDYYVERKDGLIFRQGVSYRYLLNEEKDSLVIDENGNFHNFVGSKADEILAFVKEGHQIVNAFTFGPSLVKNGEILPLPDTYLTRFNSTTRNPRMVIAQMGPLEYVFVEAQGRNDVSRGVTMEQMAQFMYDLGAIEAYNLDGGNSCVMTFNGKYYDSNYAGSERDQSDVIYVVSAVPEDTWQ